MQLKAEDGYCRQNTGALQNGHLVYTLSCNVEEVVVHFSVSCLSELQV